MLVRRDAIQDVGRFDERYVKYFEGVDIACAWLEPVGR